ncbi:MAG: ECF transporter S component [Clostridiales bacterium]|nr:ECF transporter S component [Clostridiales bacterium]
MNISKKTRTLTIAGILTAITFLLGLTPIGYIPLPTMKITLLCIPVLVGVLLEGKWVGIWLGFIFGLTSLIQIFMGDFIGIALMNISVFRTLLVVFVPRLLVPIVAFYVYEAIKLIGNKITNKMGYAIAALLGSLTNTAFFLGMMYLLFLPEMGELSALFGTTNTGMLAVIGSIVATNGVLEAVAAVIIVTAICIAVTTIKVKPKNKKIESENKL